jgi:hypothetical protein
MPVSAAAQSVRYVRADAAPGGNGTSWGSAYQHLFHALDEAAINPAITQIWVSEGTYTPNRGAGNRADTFQLVGGVGVFGGFAGDEILLEERDIAANPTILSGDFNNNDGPNFANIADNARNVMKANGSSALAAVDGFTVRGGYADYNPNDLLGGGGLLLQSATVAVRNCRFESNSAGLNAPNIGGFGGAIYNFGGNLAVNDCDFIGNRGDNGGALGSRNNGPGDMDTTITDCQFIDNFTDFGTGGAVWTGHGPFDAGVRSIHFIRCLFDHNHAQYGGAIIEQNAGQFTMTDCDFTQNEAFVFAGAVWHSQTAGKDQVPARLRGCRFIGNVADSRGGAVLFTATDSIVVNCFFAGNRSNTSSGGGIQCGPVPGANFGTGDLQADNCVFVGNHAFAAGAISLINSPMANITNCTFANNTGDSTTGGIFNQTGLTTIDNCVLWNNSANGVMNQQTQLFVSGQASSVAINHCLVQGLNGSLGGAGNFDADPQFSDVDGADNIVGTADDDLHPSAGSPAIDAGDATALADDVLDIDDDGDFGEPLPLDLDLHSRLEGRQLDVGPYEVQTAAVPGDVNGDGVVGVADVLAIIQSWGACAQPCPPSCVGDLTGDCLVNTNDLLLVIANFGN